MGMSDGFARASFTILISVVGKLQEKGIILESELAEALDKALRGLEEMNPTEEARNETHEALMLFRDILCPSRPPKPE
jgi:hypothetical protein